MTGVIPQAETQFLDASGRPLAGGTVEHYIPGTFTAKLTWQDYATTTPNTNPVVLDGAGRASIFGSGLYRQIVKDSLGNVVWDRDTVAPLTSSNALVSNTVGSIPSFAQIEFLEVPTTGTTGSTEISIDSYYGDGGAGGDMFQWVATSTATEDLGSVVCPRSQISSISGAPLFTGNGSSVTFTGTLSSSPIRPGTVIFSAGSVVAADDVAGKLSGFGVESGSVNYTTGAWSITYSVAPLNGLLAVGGYQYARTEGRWLRRAKQAKFVTDYGIMPDGTNYSNRMQSLVNVVHTNGGGTIFVPPSSVPYTMKWVMKSGVSVIGVLGAFGQNFTGVNYLSQVLSPIGGGNIIDYAEPIGPDPEGNTNLQTSIASLVIRGRGAGIPCRGINVQAARNPIIYDVAIYDVDDEALYVDDNVRIGNFTQVGGYNCLLNRTRLANTYAARIGGGDHIIEDLEFNPGLTALSSPSKFIRAIGVLGDNVRWDNLIGEFADVGITVEGLLHHGGRARGEFNFAEGYDIGSVGASLGRLFSSNNSFGSDGVYDGIVFRSTSANNQTEQWTNQNDGRGNTRYGLRDDHAGDNDKNYHGTGFSTGDRIAPMMLASVGGSFIQQSADFFTISGNSATPKLTPFLKNFRINNSSPTLVTAFTATLPGMEVCLYADNGNTTLQHNGVTFVLPGAVNLLLVAGKFYVLKQFGGAFYLISVSP